MLKRFKGSKHEDGEYECSIRPLDDSQPLKIPYRKSELASDLLCKVCEEFNIAEKDYFGLRYVDDSNQRHWLDLSKPVHKQLKAIVPKTLCFRVKYYPAEPHKLKEEITRYQLVLQLRRDLFHGRLVGVTDQVLIQLLAHVVQGELGDYDSSEMGPGYVAEFKLLHPRIVSLEPATVLAHKGLKGLTPNDADLEFLTNTKDYETYGVDPHMCQMIEPSRGAAGFIGCNHAGLSFVTNDRCSWTRPWSQVTKLDYSSKVFVVHHVSASSSSKQTTKFVSRSSADAEFLWRSAVEQRDFFTLQSHTEATKIKSGGSLFRRKSKYRFSGRSQSELLLNTIDRLEPSFNRSYTSALSRNSSSRSALSTRENTSLDSTSFQNGSAFLSDTISEIPPIEFSTPRGDHKQVSPSEASELVKREEERGGPIKKITITLHASSAVPQSDAGDLEIEEGELLAEQADGEGEEYTTGETGEVHIDTARLRQGSHISNSSTGSAGAQGASAAALSTQPNMSPPLHNETFPVFDQRTIPTVTVSLADVDSKCPPENGDIPRKSRVPAAADSSADRAAQAARILAEDQVSQKSVQPVTSAVNGSRQINHNPVHPGDKSSTSRDSTAAPSLSKRTSKGGCAWAFVKGLVSAVVMSMMLLWLVVYVLFETDVGRELQEKAGVGVFVGAVRKQLLEPVNEQLGVWLDYVPQVW